MDGETKTAIFAAGCFWGVEAEFREVKGVIDAKVGYTGGHLTDPTYEQVCSGMTAHAEAVELKFDPKQVTYRELLEKFWEIHDPTTLNRQGPDIGSQYRSAVFYLDDHQREQAEELKSELQNRSSKQIVTEITAAEKFYLAEEYHQQYIAKNGGSSCHF